MSIAERIAAIVVMLLALYGCAGLIRRLCLWCTRCPGCVCCCRVAVPRSRTALAPLFRCLQSQTVWDDSFGYRHTVVIIPHTIMESEEELQAIMKESPAVMPVTLDQLCNMVQVLAQEE